MITPTEFSSRLKARPKTSPGNSTISPDITPDRPYTRAMPSPTSITRPTSRTSMRDWYLLNFLLNYGSDLVGFEFHVRSCQSFVDG